MHFYAPPLGAVAIAMMNAKSLPRLLDVTKAMAGSALAAVLVCRAGRTISLPTPYPRVVDRRTPGLSKFRDVESTKRQADRRRKLVARLA